MTKVNLDKLQATDNGNIETVVANVELNNGVLVALGTPTGNGLEQMNVLAPSADVELLLLAQSEMHYDEKADLFDVVVKAGEDGRAYHLTVGDKFQVERTLFAVAPVVGNVVTGSATYGYKVAAGTERTKLVVEALTTFDWDARPMARLRVLSV